MLVVLYCHRSFRNTYYNAQIDDGVKALYEWITLTQTFFVILVILALCVLSPPEREGYTSLRQYKQGL